MADTKNVINIKKYRNKDSWNVGLLLFGVIFIYLSVTVITYLTKDRVVVYEVREGSILKDTAYTGLVIREETVVRASESGYINYFNVEGDKIAVGSKVYTLSPNKLSENDNIEANEEVTLTTEDWNNILQKAQAFNESFNSNQFRTAKALKEETTAILQSNTTQNRVNQLNTLLSAENTAGLKVFTSADDGIIEYTTDGFEDLEPAEITESQLDKLDYTQTALTNNTKVQAGDPVFRLITGEDWTVIIKLTPEMEKTLLDRMGDGTSLSVKIRFDSDDETMWGSLQIYNRGEDEAYGFISFSKAMIRYAQERFIDIELILDDESGLKIPKSAVTEKDFYIVPEDYLTTGGSSKETGVLRQEENKKGATLTEFVPVTVFYRDAETGMAYLDTDAFEKGDILVKTESTETFTISKTDSLQGVYNVNKGYAVFKQINILCESEEYYIVEEGNNYGLSNYDHIALDGESVQENDVVTQ